MRHAWLSLLLLAACDAAPSTQGLKQVPAVAAADAGSGGLEQPDGGTEPDAGASFPGECLALGCPVELCEPLDGGARCGVALDSPCADAGLCAESTAPSDAGWVGVYCTPAMGVSAWRSSPDCDDPADHCATGDTCHAGACDGGAAPSCPPDACHGACLPATGKCAINSGADCDDGDACTTGDTCQGDGSCSGQKTGAVVHRYSDAAACEWYYGDNPGTGWTDEGVQFRSAPGGDAAISQLFDNDSLGRPLTTDPTAWSAVGGFTVTESDVITAFGASQPGSSKLVRYRFVAGSSCQVSGWARYFSTTNASEAPAGSSVSDTPPGVSTVDTNMWVCPP